MKLNEIKLEGKYAITGFNSKIDLALYNKFITMGLGVGTEIITVKPISKGIVMFYVDNMKLCIREKDAQYIEVDENE